MDRLREVVQRGLRQVDRCYHRVHHLRGVGPALYVGRDRHRGPTLCLPDRTELHDGDAIGVLHFNNDRFSRIDGRSARRAALDFARLMLQSLAELAQLVREDASFRDLKAFHGVTWLPAHGARVGFVAAPYPEGWKKRWLHWHFKLLIWAFAPARESRLAQPDPHHFWLTRKELLQRFSSPDDEADRAHLLRTDARTA